MRRSIFFALLGSVLIGSAAYAQNTGADFDWQQRWDYYLHRTYSLERMSLLAADTAFDHITTGKTGGPREFAEHYAGGFATRITRTSIELGAGALLREDARRYRSNLKGFGPRFRFAMTHALAARGPDGGWRPAYSRFAGMGGGIMVNSAFYGRAITTGRVAEGLLHGFAFNFQDSLLNEFEPELTRTGRGIARSCFRRWVKFR